MAYTFQGIGTTFLGKREFRSDGSYVTTEWVVFLYIPLLPICSKRVIEEGSTENTGWFPFLSYKDTYRVLSRTRPNWRQVFYVYGFVLLYAFWLVFVLRPLSSLDVERALVKVLWLVALGAPGLIPYFLRRYARHKGSAEHAGDKYYRAG